MKKMSTSLNMREMQIKTSYTSHRSKSIGRNSTINAGEGVEKREPSYTDAPSGNGEQPLWRTPGRFLSNENENEIGILPNTTHRKKLQID